MSGTVVAVYSRVLEPNQDILITEDVTVQITNITLEVDEKSTDTTRSVLKMQHLEAHPALLQAVAGYDMSDSEDDFDSDEDEEDEDDEDSLDEDELADMSKLSKLSAASGSSKKGASAAAATNGKAAEEEDDEENHEDFDSMEDDEEDSDEDEDDYDRQEAEVQICSLLPGKVEHFNTNIILPGGEDFVFRLSGSHKVHIFGHYIVQPTPPQLDEDPYGEDEYGSEYDSEDDSEDDDEEIDSDDLLEEDEMGMYNPVTGLLNTWEMAIPDIENSDAVDDDYQDVSSRFMEIEEPKEAKKSKKSEAPAAAAAAAPAASASEADKSKLSKNQLKKLAKKEKDAAAPAAATAAPVAEKKAAAAKKDEAAKPAAAAAPTPAKKAPSKKTTLPSGLVYEDNKAGTGATAKSGQRVSMRYIGRLNNGKIFDQNTKGAPFSFKLGKGEVIKGWDEGIAGMQVGGERKLVIPAKLAYGKQGVEGIPPNSTLTFEVKLLGVK